MRKVLSTVGSCTVLSAILLAGCASNSGVVPIGQDTFMVSRQAATGFSGSGTLKAEAFKEATDFCSKRSQMLQVVSTHEASPPYILANFPKAEVQFMCLDTKDAELGRPKLHKEPDTIVEVKQPVVLPHDSDKPRDLYGELIKLDELRKKGLISDAEFDAQKAKLLAAQ